MKKEKSIIIIFLIVLWSDFGFGQKNFNSCSAAFLNNKMLVNEYSPAGKCSVSITEKGHLTVSTVELSANKSKAVDSIIFQVAIRNKETGTVMLFSNEKIRKIEIQKVLEKCKKGDHILVITLNDKYALPHNEILVL